MGVRTAPSLQHYPENNEDEDEDEDDDDDEDKDEDDDDLYRAWVYFSQRLLCGQHQRVFPQPRVCNITHRTRRMKTMTTMTMTSTEDNKDEEEEEEDLYRA